MLTLSLYSVSKALLTLIYSKGNNTLILLERECCQTYSFSWIGMERKNQGQHKQRNLATDRGVQCVALKKCACLCIFMVVCFVFVISCLSILSCCWFVQGRSAVHTFCFFVEGRTKPSYVWPLQPNLRGKWHYVTMILERCDYHVTPAVHHSTSEYVHLYDETEPLKLQRKMKVGMPSSRNKHPRWTREEWLNKTRFSNIIFLKKNWLHDC